MPVEPRKDPIDIKVETIKTIRAQGAAFLDIGDTLFLMNLITFVMWGAGSTGLSIISQKGDTLLDLEAETDDIRSTWVHFLDADPSSTPVPFITISYFTPITSQVTSLQLLCDGCIVEETASAASFRQTIEDKAKRQVYWKQRTDELEARKQEAEERKKRFASAGMKYTAIAMSNRTGSAPALKKPES